MRIKLTIYSQETAISGEDSQMYFALGQFKACPVSLYSKHLKYKEILHILVAS